MKSIITKSITIGIMLLLAALIVSRFPQKNNPKPGEQSSNATTVSKLAIPSATGKLRTN